MQKWSPLNLYDLIQQLDITWFSCGTIRFSKDTIRFGTETIWHGSDFDSSQHLRFNQQWYNSFHQYKMQFYSAQIQIESTWISTYMIQFSIDTIKICSTLIQFSSATIISRNYTIRINRNMTRFSADRIQFITDTFRFSTDMIQMSSTQISNMIICWLYDIIWFGMLVSFSNNAIQHLCNLFHHLNDSISCRYI